MTANLRFSERYLFLRDQDGGYEELAGTLVSMIPSTKHTLDQCLHFFFPKLIIRAWQTPPDDRIIVFSYNNLNVWFVALHMRNARFDDPDMMRTLLQGIEDDEGVNQEPPWQECL